MVDNWRFDPRLYHQLIPHLHFTPTRAPKIGHILVAVDGEPTKTYDIL
jgi:hypothetical protein